jgi:hypothetical protein
VGFCQGHENLAVTTAIFGGARNFRSAPDELAIVALKTPSELPWIGRAHRKRRSSAIVGAAL